MLELTLREFTDTFGAMHSTYSTDWSMGGYFCCCWDEDEHPIAEEHEPEHVDYLVEQLLITFGNSFNVDILQLEYTKDEYAQSDWYGGQYNIGTKSISVAEIYSALIESKQLKIVD